METTKPFCPSCGKPLDSNALKGLCPECLMKGAFPTGTDTSGKTPRFDPPKIDELAAKFPQLEVLEIVGQGGMGAVYKARQKQLDRLVALKILPPQTGSGPGFAERFTREARALAKLNHPHIVTLYEFGQADGLFYFLMEFVDGMDLRQLLHASRLAPKEALAIVPQICEALQYAHDRGIVHRDIKPENILLSKDGQVKIADFGVAKIVAQGVEEAAEKTVPHLGELTEAGSALGTPRYMAPEQIKNSAEVDHRADIYSVGVVFYQMLTGDLPLGKFEPPSKKVQIDVRLDEVVLRALQQNPELRYQQASQIKTALETITCAAPPTAKTFSAHRRFWVIAGTTALVPVVLAAAIFLLHPSKFRAPVEEALPAHEETGTSLPANDHSPAVIANQQPPTDTAPEQVSVGLTPEATNFAAQFEAVKGIEDRTLRDMKLIQLAKDAARTGNAEMAELVLETIVVANFRDDAAIVCARLLAKAGKPAEARAVAKSINFPQTREILLSQLSEPPPPGLDIAVALRSKPVRSPASKDLAKQFATLKAIEDWAGRDIKLVQFAKEVARAGDADLTELVLETIISANARDDAAIVCVPLLVKLGQPAQAAEVADGINWPATRKVVFEELAEALPQPAKAAVTNPPLPSLVVGGDSNALSQLLQSVKRIEDPTKRDQALAQLAKGAAATGQVEETEVYLETIISAPLRDEAGKACAGLLVKSGQRAGAVEVAKMITNRDLRKATLSELNEQSCAQQPAIDPRITALLQKLPTNVVAAIQTNDFAKAQSMALEATRQDPLSAEAWIADGMASARLDQSDRARQSYERALALYEKKSHENPSDANSIFEQVFLLTLLNRSADADSLLEQARKNYPDDDQLSALARHFSETKAGLTDWMMHAH
ncbi:MAG: protein kinase domain-containing protein [Limisphaerales bacterium]